MINTVHDFIKIQKHYWWGFYTYVYYKFILSDI